VFVEVISATSTCLLGADLLKRSHGQQGNPVSLLSYKKNRYGNRSGTAVAQCCATNRKVADSIPAGVFGFFIDIKPFRSHYGPGVDSASNRNEYQEHFLGVKAAGA